MFKSLWIKILSLFDKKTSTTNKEFRNNELYAIQYESIRDVNITAMFSNKMSNFTVNGSSVEVEEKNKRGEILNDILQQVWKEKKKITARCYGTGGVALVPYVQSETLMYDIVAQSRLSINKIISEKIVDATLLADTYVVNNALTTDTYYRWADYKIENNNLYIIQRYTDSEGNKINKLEYWENVKDEIVIPNVDRVSIAYIKSPVDNRLTNGIYGVPITYGCSKTINRIMDTLNQIDREYDLKEAFVGADITMFNGEHALTENGLYRKVDSGEDSFWEVFDPSIRDSPFFNKLNSQFAQLEKEIGTSRGVLTDPLSTYQNTDEVRRSIYDTMSIVKNMRDNVVVGLNDFLYSCDVLANYYSLSPMGDYELKVNWDNSLVENYNDTINNYNIGIDKGYVSKAEARNFLMEGETLEESEEAVAKIKENNPTVQDILGTND